LKIKNFVLFFINLIVGDDLIDL